MQNHTKLLSQAKLLSQVNLKSQSDVQLEESFSELVKSERKITYEVLVYLQEIEARRLHLALGYSSLGEYLIKKHHYSEGAACRRVNAMRMLQSVPEVKDKIIGGNLNLSQLSIAQVAITKKQKEEDIKVTDMTKRDLISKIENQTFAETKSQIASTLNIELPHKKELTYGKKQTVYLNFKFTKEEFERISACLDLISHLVSDYKGLMLYLSEKILKSKKVFEPTEHGATQSVAPNVENCVQQKSDHEQQHSNHNETARYIPSDLKRRIYKRDQWKCQFKTRDGKICGSKRFLQIHHIKPFAKGGKTIMRNLSLRCWSHNLYEAEKEGLLIKEFEQLKLI